MEEQREESEFVGDCKEPMEEEAGKGLSSKTQTLDGEDVETVEVLVDSCVSVTHENPNGGGSATGDVNTDDLVSDEKQVKVDVASVEATMSEIKSKNGGESHGIAGEDESVISTGGNEVIDEKENCEVEDNGNDCDAEHKMGVDSEQEKEVKVGLPYNDQGEESAKKNEEDNNETDIDSKQAMEENVGLNEQGNPGNETTGVKHSESAQMPEESTQLSEGETNEENPGANRKVSSATQISREEERTNVNQKEGEAMEVDCAAEESTDASVVQTQDVPIAEADGNDASVVNEMEIDERKGNAVMTSDLTGTIESTDSANPNSPTEDAAPGEVEPLDHNALFDPSSDITNFIDFSGVSSWSGNLQDLKTEIGNVSLKEDKKATDMAEEVATVDAESHDNLSLNAEGVENESNEARAAAECPRETSDAIMGSDENQEDKQTIDQQVAMRKEDDSTHEAPSIDPNQEEDTEMEENPNNSDFADDGTDSDIKTNGVKRKADVLSEDSPEEGRKTVSLPKVSFAQRPSFKIGASIARAASQMAGSPSVLKGGNIGDKNLSVESFVSQLHCAATDPAKENVVSDLAADFFLDFRNSSASQQVTPEKVSSKRGRPSNSNAGGTKAFEFEEMGDTYWTDRVIHNGGEEQTPPTEKGNYQVVPVELKPSQVKKTRRPYRRRHSQITIPLPSASDKPANFDENAPAELIMKFSETDTIPPEKSLSKMFRHFGPIRESQTEVDKDNNRARVVYRKGTDAEVAYNSAGRFSIFGTKAVNYELSYTITEAFKVQPYVVSLGEEDAALCLPS
ncbi:unnamed protein product [Arabis nemorensis]|uniref:Uncharacterized protein n=1 Tax=Arabis nemorensis TaxID=586526 RepID=A0A565BWE7_9BRAS|nr:unnamed protein product [Arabis nemorensis]